MKKIVVRILLVTAVAVTSGATPSQIAGFDGGPKPPICIPSPCIALPVQ